MSLVLSKDVFVLSVFLQVVVCGCITLEERCLLSVSAIAPFLSRAPTVTNATVGTLPQSARSLQVCVTMRETDRESWEQRDTQMGRIESEENEE